MRTLFITFIFFSLFFTAFGQTPETEKSNSYNGYILVGGKYSTVFNDPAGYLDIKAGLTINKNWSIGVAVSGLDYDKKLTKLVTDGTYHLSIGFVGLFIEKHFNLYKDFSLTVGIISGSGEANYRYDKDYRENRPYYQEFIDKEEFFVLEPYLDVAYKVFDNWSVGLTGSYRNTSPLNLIQTDDKLINNFSTGISIKYQIF